MLTRLSRSARVGSVVLLVLVAGCDGEGLIPDLTRPPEAVTAFASVPAGTASIDLILSNRSVKDWEYGGCAHSLDRRGPDGWTTVHNGRQVLCAAVGYSLRAGQSVTVTVPLPPEQGAYRIRFDFLHFPNDRLEVVEVTSNVFAVGVVPLPAVR
jgi:hypothetical protein